MFCFVFLLMFLFKPNITSGSNNRVAKTHADISNIKNALALYYNDNESYPSGEEGLQALVTAYSVNIIDPWYREYYYTNLGEGKGVHVFTLGRDGTVGGCGYSRDIFSSTEYEGVRRTRECTLYQLAKIEFLSTK